MERDNDRSVDVTKEAIALVLATDLREGSMFK